MRGQQERAAEALDLKRPLGLSFHAPPEAVPAEESERTDDCEHDATEREQRARETAPAHGDTEER